MDGGLEPGYVRTPKRAAQAVVLLLIAAGLSAWILLDGAGLGAVRSGEQVGIPDDDRPVSAAWVVERISFVQAPAELPVGPIDVMLTLPPGGTRHNVVIEGYHDDKPLLQGSGPIALVTTIDLAPGTYTYYCSIGGHRSLGMEGALTVR